MSYSGGAKGAMLAGYASIVARVAPEPATTGPGLLPGPPRFPRERWCRGGYRGWGSRFRLRALTAPSETKQHDTLLPEDRQQLARCDGEGSGRCADHACPRLHITRFRQAKPLLLS